MSAVRVVTMIGLTDTLGVELRLLMLQKAMLSRLALVTWTFVVPVIMLIGLGIVREDRVKLGLGNLCL